MRARWTWCVEALLTPIYEGLRGRKDVSCLYTSEDTTEYLRTYASAHRYLASTATTTPSSASPAYPLTFGLQPLQASPSSPTGLQKRERTPNNGTTPEVPDLALYFGGTRFFMVYSLVTAPTVFMGLLTVAVLGAGTLFGVGWLVSLQVPKGM